MALPFWVLLFQTLLSGGVDAKNKRGPAATSAVPKLLRRDAFASLASGEQKVSFARHVLDTAARARGGPARPSSRSYYAPSTTTTTEAASLLFVPAAFGGDPTGKNDSTAGVLAARDAALDVASPISMAEGIRSLGGAGVDLAGGTYVVGEPLTYPAYVGDVTAVRNGALVAAASFPSDRHLVEIGSQDCDAGSQGSCNEFVTIEGVFFDARHAAAGGVRISTTMGATVRDVFFVGFVETGLRVDGGHETLLADAWLAEYYWDETPAANASSIGVQLNGNDHSLDNVVVFDYATVGVEVNNPASTLTNVHTWNGGGVGIRLNANQARLEHCYLDYDYLEINDPESVVVHDTFFLGTYALLASNATTGLRMRHNTYAGTPENGPSVRLAADVDFASRGGVDDVVIEDDAGDGVVSTVARKVIDVVNSEKNLLSSSSSEGRPRVRSAERQQADDDVLAVDFGAALVFPSIDYVQLTARGDGVCQPPTAWTVNGTTLYFDAASLVGCSTLFVEVRQGLPK